MNKKVIKPISPLQAMTQNFSSFKENIINTSGDALATIEQVIQIDVNKICNWVLHDRPEEELGDLNQLAEDIKINGQQNPCIVRPSTHKDFEYELIAGERRWRACQIANIKVKVIVKNLTDSEAALCQASENSNRKDLSDYAKGVNYSKLLEQKILTQQDLAEKLNKSQSYIRNLLSFAKIPSQIKKLIGNINNISGASAYEIYRLSEKGQTYFNVLIEIAPKIGISINNDKKIQNSVNKELLNSKQLEQTNHKENKVSKENNFFSWQNNSKGVKSISFSKDIINKLDFTLIEKALVLAINEQLESCVE